MALTFGVKGIIVYKVSHGGLLNKTEEKTSIKNNGKLGEF